MKILYQCEICGNTYKKKQECLNCEARQKSRQIIPTGTILKLHNRKMVFAVAGGYVLNGHSFDYHFWACRDTGIGDSLGKEKCGGELLASIDFILDGKPNLYSTEEEMRKTSKYYAVSDGMRKSPAFKRLVKYLKKKKIKPTYWNGKKINPC